MKPAKRNISPTIPIKLIAPGGMNCRLCWGCIRNEKAKWICPECGELICVHRPECLSCGYQWH